MKSSITQHLPAIHLWRDVSFLNLSFLLVFFPDFKNLSDLHQQQQFILLLMVNLIWVFCIHIFRVYVQDRYSPGLNGEFFRFLKAVVANAAMIFIFFYFTGLNSDFSYSKFLGTLSIFTAISIIARNAEVVFLQFYRRKKSRYIRYAIIGKGATPSLIRQFYSERRDLGYRYCGVFEPDKEENRLEMLENLFKTEKLDYVYCCFSEMNSSQVTEIIKLSERQRVQIRLVPDFLELNGVLTSVDHHLKYPVFQVDAKPFVSFNEQTSKRIFDIVFSLTVMIAGAPVFVAVWAAIKLTSPGPVFFKQERSGRWGEIFEIYKFRSMRVDSHKMGLMHSQGDSDPRITPIGRILRKSRLDELPQFINVLKGEMSVVGPRPLYKYDVEMLMKAAPHDFQRLLTVKPGITSIGQINVGYADTEQKNVERLKHDLQYLKPYKVFDDLLLIILTVKVMVLGQGK